MPLKESHKRILVLLSSLLAWFLAETYVKAPMAHLMRPLVSNFGDGPKLFLSHLIIDSFFPALLCALYWWFLCKKVPLEPVYLRTRLKRALWDGLWAGLFIVVLTIPLAYYRWNFEFQFHPDFWKITGNIFSNTYEEIQYRGFLLLAGLYALRNKHLANLFAAICFAYVHTQYPPEIRAYVGVVGLIMGYAFLKTRNFAAPILAHCIGDWILDSIFK